MREIDEFEAIVVTHRDALLRHAHRRTRDHGAAEDAVQETLIRAFRAFGRLEPDSRIGPWLHQILANVCNDHSTRSNREAVKVDLLTREPEASGISTSVEQQLGLDVENRQLEDAMALLPGDYQRALTMRFVEELSYDELATSIGVTLPNARARVSRARHAIRLSLQGAAAFPVIAYIWLRRSKRAAAALERTQIAVRASDVGGGGGSSAVGKLSISLAPTIEAANSMIAGAQTGAGPMLARLAVGVTLAGAATLGLARTDNFSIRTRTDREEVRSVLETAGASAVPVVDSTSLASSAAVVATGDFPSRTDAARAATDQGAPDVAEVGPLTAGSGSTDVVSDGVILEMTTTTILLATVPTVAVVPPTFAPVLTSVAATTTSVAATTTAVAATTSTVIDEPATVDPSVITTSNPSSETSTTFAAEVTTTVDPGATIGSATVSPTTTTTTTTTAAPVRPGAGSVTVSAVTSTPVGPRTEISGETVYVVEGRRRTGWMQGRLLLDPVVAANGSQFVEGSVTVSTDDGETVEVRLKGSALVAADGSMTLTGAFRASGGAGDLASSGSFSGQLGSAFTLGLVA